ncbi:A24 family peptidase [Bacillus sp. FJAT-44742]|uniref:A24 family peptidase n=1 Tax=Bacillus sp. FJAT-44742 TaxID=2014005 RepID=UPI000C237457|nr:prepilin peptidase [Bacillus sp. FJAT-44742]
MAAVIDIFLILVLVICVATDIKSRKIYNKVIYPSLLAAFIYHLAAGGWEGLSHSFIGFLIGMGLLFIPYALGGMGAGDVKLLGLIGALKGGTFVFHSFLYIALAGAVMALAVIFFRKGVLKSLFYTLASRKSGVSLTEGISIGSLKATYPYGVPIAAGVVITLFVNGWTVL